MRHLAAMSLLNNAISIHFTRFVLGVGSRSVVVGREHLPKAGQPVLLAVSHLSHYDPVVVAGLLRRRIDWMARAEFYRTPGSRWACRHSDCIELDRDGHALPGLREAWRRLSADRWVGIFPEGEIMAGDMSVLNGGPIRGGAALLARRAGVPIIPCVVLNSDQHRRVMPWLPLRRGRLWLGIGEPIHAPPGARPGRDSRQELSARLEESLREIYWKLLESNEIAAEARP